MEERASLERALEIIDESVSPLSEESVEVMLSAGRVLAEPVSAWVDLPNVDISTRDGVALRSQDSAEAGPDSPVALKVIGKASVISPFEGSVGPKSCLRVFSGSVMPEGADAVAEDELISGDGETIELAEAVEPGRGVRKRASEFGMGELIAPAGITLTPGWIALLIAAGWSEIKAVKQPRIWILAVGDELKNPGRALEPGDVFPSAAACVFALSRKLGAGEVRLIVLGDDIYDLQEEIPDESLADIAITVGGSGHSERDVVIGALEELGAEIKFRGMSVHPGHYTSLAMLGNMPVLCLPGGPPSAELMIQLLGRRIVSARKGEPKAALPVVAARMAEPVAARDDADHIIRVRIETGDQGLIAHPLKSNNAHLDIAQTKGILRLAHAQSLKAGDQVELWKTD